MQAVVLDRDGSTHELTLRSTSRGIYANRTRLCVLFHDPGSGLAVLSKHDARRLQCAGVAPFDLELPVPLNAYVYPNPIVVCAMSQDGALGACSTAWLATRFDELRAAAVAVDGCDEERSFLYDMPVLQPLAEDDGVEEADDLNEYEDEDEFDPLSDDEELDEDEEEAWADDDIIDA